LKFWIQIGRQGVLIAVVFTAALSGAYAQVFHVQAGTSSLQEAHGGSVSFLAPGYEGSIGVGYVNGGMQYGGVLRTDFHGYRLTAGDDTVDFSLPTDNFNLGHYFYGRGAGISRKTGKNKYTVFGGMTSRFVGASFFQAAEGQDPFGLIFMESQLSTRMKFVSRTVMTNKLTFLNGLSFSPNRGIEMGATAGLGSGKPYIAGSFDVDRPRYTLKAAFVGADRDFRRVSVDAPLATEVDRENVYFQWRPVSRWSVSVARQNVLSPVSPATPTSSRALLHNVASNLRLFGARFNGSLYLSETGNVNNTGMMFGANRTFLNRVEVGADYFRNRTDRTRFNSESYSGRLREVLTQKLSLTQYVSRSNGQTSWNFGGEFNANRFSLAVSHETAYVPFRPVEFGGPFVRVYNVSLRFRPWGSTEITAQSNVDPNGRVRYTVAGSDYYYRYAGLESAQAAPLKINQYVVKGIVLDQDERPVAGAALQIDGQVVFTDSEGRFLVRFPRRSTESFRVLLEDFLTNFWYDVESAPTNVETITEDQAKDLIIRLRRITDRDRIQQRLTAMRQAEDEKAGGGTAPSQ
jgi:hypothetical protein